MDPFLTTYKKDYIKKSTKRLFDDPMKSEFKDPINVSFQNHLQLGSENRPLEDPEEIAEQYMKAFSQRYPKLAEVHFPTPLNDGIVTKNFKYDGKSTYQVTYCDLNKDAEYKEEMRVKGLFRLPADVYIPLTTYLNGYRNPLVLNSRAMEKVQQIRTENNLDPNEHVRNILKVTTGVTEYGGVISGLGNLIMNEELHGKIEPPTCFCAEHSSKNTNQT